MFTLGGTPKILGFTVTFVINEKTTEVNKNCFGTFLRIGLKDIFSTGPKNMHLQKVNERCKFKI